MGNLLLRLLLPPSPPLLLFLLPPLLLLPLPLMTLQPTWFLSSAPHHSKLCTFRRGG